MSDFTNNLSSYMPPAEGWLPKWLLFISIVSIGNSIQAYSSLAGTREVYAGPAPRGPSPVTALSARTFGTWTALSSVVRLYGAYHIGDARVYELCLWTYGIALAHFLGEWLVFGSARFGRGLISPLVVSVGTTAWMLTQWGYYVG